MFWKSVVFAVRCESSVHFGTSRGADASHGNISPIEGILNTVKHTFVFMPSMLRLRLQLSHTNYKRSIQCFTSSKRSLVAESLYTHVLNLSCGYGCIGSKKLVCNRSEPKHSNSTNGRRAARAGSHEVFSLGFEYSLVQESESEYGTNGLPWETIFVVAPPFLQITLKG